MRIATKKELHSRRRVVQTIKALPKGVVPSIDQSITKKLLGDSY
jgi:hypothetical protein